ncbi:MAG: hypothetical protein MJ081_02450 [Ruminococcus sp.]|nr:hypothetical protein [Ruminococcus sp.]
MKKKTYMAILLICGLVIGDVIGNHSSGSFSFLALKAGFEFNPGTLAITNVFSITIGLAFYMSVAQALMVIFVFFVYYKTAGKICD